MMQDGPWNRYRQQPAPQQGPVFVPGAPKQPDALDIARENRAIEDQAMQRQQFERTERRQAATDARATQAAGRLPGDKEKELREAVDIATSLERADGSFNPNYLGLGSSLENFAQSYVDGIGTPGQRAWWADFKRTDNIERNALFGASLSGGEKAAYAATTITPDMTPEQARLNIAKRKEIVQAGLARYRDYLVKSGYNSEAIDALMGVSVKPTVRRDRFGTEVPDQGGDMQVHFPGDDKPVTGQRYTPQQEAVIIKAIHDGDLGQVLSLQQRYSGNPPDDAAIRSARAAIDAVRKDPRTKVKVGYGAIDAAAQDASDKERFGEFLAPAMQERRGSGIDATVRGAADTASFGLADEIAAAGNTLFGGGTMRENLQRERAIDEADRRVNAAPRFVGQLTGAVVNPLGRNAATVGEVTKAGALGGALYGFGSGETMQGRATGALGGGTAGAGGGYVVGRASNALAGVAARRAEARAAEMGETNALLAAADRQQIQPMAADVGGPLVRNATAAAAQAPLSAPAIVRGGERVVNQSRAARDRIASNTGQVLDRETAGEIGQQGGEKFIAATRQQADRYYERAEKLAEGAKITPTRTIAALDRHIAELSEDPSAVGSSHLTALQKLRDAIGSGQLSVSGIRGMRSRLRQQFIDDGLRSSDFQRRVGEVVDSASEDLTSNLIEQGMDGAATAFRRADQFYRGRVQAIDTFLEPIIAGKSGEGVMKALESAAKGNGRRLQGFVASLPAEERAAVQATMISRLGAKNADAEAADFSLDVFLSQWKATTPRAKAALFPKPAREALNDLATVAEGSKAAGAYANRSNTGGVVATLATGGIAGNAFWAPVSTSIALAGQYGAGKMLAHPGFARWLANAPKTDRPGAITGWINRIPQIPAVRGEIEQLQQRLLANFAQSPSRVNAGDREQD